MMARESNAQRLRQKGLKVTPQRLAILDALEENRSLHPTAFQTYREAKKRCRGLSLSTVYATLHELSRHGLIKTLEFDQMENRYEVNLEAHVNLICEGCGRIIDYPAPLAVDPTLLQKATGFQVRNSRLEYYGFCRECLNASASSPPHGEDRGGKVS